MKTPSRRRNHRNTTSVGAGRKVSFAGVEESRSCLSKDSYFLKTFAGLHAKKSFKEMPIIEFFRLVERIRSGKEI